MQFAQDVLYKNLSSNMYYSENVGNENAKEWSKDFLQKDYKIGAKLVSLYKQTKTLNFEARTKRHPH